MPRSARQQFYDVLAAAVRDIINHGFDGPQRVQEWMLRLRMAAKAALMPEVMLHRMLRDSLMTTYRRMVEHGGIMQRHPGVGRFTIEKVKPELRAELDRRIAASAELIRLNREQSIQRTLQRFSGWAMSVPAGGAPRTAKARETNEQLRKAMAQLPFEERRVIIDQGHKLASSINEVVAQGGGAIAAIWQSNWRQAGYDYREDHRERDGKVYLIRGSWAQKAGYVKPGDAGYTDQIERPAELPFCRCYYRFLYTLNDLPAEMLTQKGKSALQGSHI